MAKLTIEAEAVPNTLFDRRALAALPSRKRESTHASFAERGSRPGRRMNWETFWEALLKPLRAAVFIFTHTVLALLVLVSIYGVERFIAYLWQQREPLLLDFVPLRYLFDAIDIGVLTIFGFRGILAAYRAFKD